MRIKFLVLSLVVATLAITCSTTTLAYLTDTDNSEVVFTVGNVQIANHTITSGTCEGMVKDDICTKTFSVENLGTVDAFTRVRVLIPETLLSENSPTLQITTANDEFIESPDSVYCNGISGDLCKEYVSTWTDVLTASTTATPRSLNFEYLLDLTTSTEGENTTGASINLANLGIKVYTEAIQAQGFQSASEAFTNFN